MDTEKTLTSFDGALLGALEGDRLGLVVGCKVMRRRRRTYHVSLLSERDEIVSGILWLFITLLKLTSVDGDPVGPFEGDTEGDSVGTLLGTNEGESVGLKVVGLDVGCVNK